MYRGRFHLQKCWQWELISKVSLCLLLCESSHNYLPSNAHADAEAPACAARVTERSGTCDSQLSTLGPERRSVREGSCTAYSCSQPGPRPPRLPWPISPHSWHEAAPKLGRRCPRPAFHGKRGCRMLEGVREERQAASGARAPPKSAPHPHRAENTLEVLVSRCLRGGPSFGACAAVSRWSPHDFVGLGLINGGRDDRSGDKTQTSVGWHSPCGRLCFWAATTLCSVDIPSGQEVLTDMVCAKCIYSPHPARVFSPLSQRCQTHCKS